MERQLLFNHIPKTGGTTLRIIFNRVYGPDRVFFIQSKNIGKSLDEFKNLDKIQRSTFRVVSGHGAGLFAGMLIKPFRISILREPLSLFLSQYHYLKKSPDSNFLKEVSELKSEEEYLEYAVAHGQDNLLTRYFSNSVQWLADPEIPIPNLEKEGTSMLEQAISNLRQYDALIDLSRFDKGVYALSRKLNWSKIPIYRPSNLTKKDNPVVPLSKDYMDQLRHVLRWDIALYEYFINEKLDISLSEPLKRFDYPFFLFRQKAVVLLSKMLGKS